MNDSNNVVYKVFEICIHIYIYIYNLLCYIAKLYEWCKPQRSNVKDEFHMETSARESKLQTALLHRQLSCNVEFSNRIFKWRYQGRREKPHQEFSFCFLIGILIHLKFNCNRLKRFYIFFRKQNLFIYYLVEHC